MSFSRYCLLVVALVVLGLVTVWEHLRLLSVGSEVNDLRAQRGRLEEESRVLERRIDAMATPGAVSAHVREMGLDLTLPVSRSRGGRP
jgi:hypothetical protein